MVDVFPLKSYPRNPTPLYIRRLISDEYMIQMKRHANINFKYMKHTSYTSKAKGDNLIKNLGLNFK
jgi:hypothetical protein